jgi:hypothetical protein
MEIEKRYLGYELNASNGSCLCKRMGCIARFAAESDYHKRQENSIKRACDTPANRFNNGLFASFGHFMAENLP